MTKMCSFSSQCVKAIQTNQVWSFIFSNATFFAWDCFGVFVSDVQRFHWYAQKGLSRGIALSFPVMKQQTPRDGRHNHRKAAAPLSEASYSLLPASSPSLFDHTWGCREHCRRGKPSASRCPWWCRGWRSAWSGQRTYRGPKSSSPGGCQMSYSGCWCSGRTDARPSSSDAGTESWWSPVGEEQSFTSAVWMISARTYILKRLQIIYYHWCFCMNTQYLNINVIELFNADRITWSHRSSAALKLPSSTVDSITLKWMIKQGFSHSRLSDQTVIWVKVLGKRRDQEPRSWASEFLHADRCFCLCVSDTQWTYLITRFLQMLPCAKTDPDRKSGFLKWLWMETPDPEQLGDLFLNPPSQPTH